MSLALAAPGASAAVHYQRLKSFGSPPGKTLHSFNHSFPSRLIEADDGALYGTAAGEFDIPGASVFKLSKDGSSYSILFHITDKESQSGHFRPAFPLELRFDSLLQA